MQQDKVMDMLQEAIHDEMIKKQARNCKKFMKHDEFMCMFNKK